MLWWVIRRTRAGLEMRAVVDRSDLAGLRGVNAGAHVGARVDPDDDPRRARRRAHHAAVPAERLVFTLVVLGSLAAVAFGGLRSIPIGFVGGLLLGIVQNLLAGYGDDFLPGFLAPAQRVRSPSIPFILTLLLLCSSSQRATREAGLRWPTSRPRPIIASVFPAWRRRLPWSLFTVALRRVLAPVDRRRLAPGGPLRAGR